MRKTFKAIWSALVAKRTVGGWLFALLWALFYISDKWDSAISLFNKLRQMGPWLKLVADLGQSPITQPVVFGLGFLWIGIAVIIGLRAPKSIAPANDGIYYDLVKQVVAQFKAGIKDEGGEIQKKSQQRQECFESYISTHDQSHLMAASLIKANAHKLEQNVDLLGLCDDLSHYGHTNPLDYWRGYVPDDDSLNFLKKVAYSPERLTDDAHGAGVLHVAMVKWQEDHNYPEPSKDRQLDALANKVFVPSFVAPVPVPPFRVTGLDTNIDRDEFVAHLLFQNDTESERAILSIRAIYWASDRVWKNGYMFLGDDGGSMRLGNIDNAFVLSSKAKQTVIHRIKVQTEFLETPGAEFGLHIVTGREQSGKPQDAHFRLLKVITAPESAGGVNYALHSAVNISLDETTPPL